MTSLQSRTYDVRRTTGVTYKAGFDLLVVGLRGVEHSLQDAHQVLAECVARLKLAEEVSNRMHVTQCTSHGFQDNKRGNVA